MFGAAAVVVMAAARQAQCDAEIERKMRESLPPEQYKEWRTEQTAERRHRELCEALRASGRSQYSPWNPVGSRTTSDSGISAGSLALGLAIGVSI